MHFWENSTRPNITGKIPGTVGDVLFDQEKHTGITGINTELKAIERWNGTGWDILIQEFSGESGAAGNTTEVQYNKDGMLAGDSVFTWDDTNKRIGINKNIPESRVDVGSSRDGDEMLRFSTDRPWGFFQDGTAPTTELTLRNTAGSSSKFFNIKSVNNTYNYFRVFTESEGYGYISIPDGSFAVGRIDKLSRFTIKEKASKTINGTASIESGSNIVSGTGTRFTFELGIGDRITINGETRAIIGIITPSSLAVNKSFSSTASDQAINAEFSIFRLENKNASVVYMVDDQGNTGIGTAATTEKFEVNGKIKATRINFTGLPTSQIGLEAGDVWNDSGTLKIVS